MRKFSVMVKEVCVYRVEVRATGRADAEERAEELIVQSADRDKYFSYCADREAYDAQPVAKVKPKNWLG